MNNTLLQPMLAQHPAIQLQRSLLPHNITIVISTFNRNPYPGHSVILKDGIEYDQIGKIIQVTVLVNDTPQPFTIYPTSFLITLPFALYPELYNFTVFPDSYYLNQREKSESIFKRLLESTIIANWDTSQRNWTT